MHGNPDLDRPRATVPAGRPEAGARRALVGMVLVVSGAALPLFLIGGSAVQVRAELDLGNAAFGAVVTGFFVVASALSMPAGRLVERLPSSTVLRAAAGITTASLLAVAVLARSWASLVVLVAAGGVAMAAAEPAGNILVAELVPPHRQGLAFGLKQGSFPLAAFVSGLAVAAIGVTVGWRWTIAGACAVPLAGMVVTPRSARRPPRAAEGRRPLDASRRTMVVLTCAVAFGSAGGASFSSFVVSTAVDTGLSATAAGVLFAVASVCGLPLRLLAGHLGDRAGGDVLRVAIVLALLGVTGYLLLGTGSTAFVVAGAFLAFGLGWGWIGALHLAVVRLNPQSPGAATGFVQTGNYFGAMAGPVGFGLVADHHSYGTAWTMVAGWLVVAAMGLAAGRRLATVPGGQPTVRPPSTT